jgi:hypothetical protein
MPNGFLSKAYIVYLNNPIFFERWVFIGNTSNLYFFIFVSFSFILCHFQVKLENIHGSQCFMLWLFGVTLKLTPASICPIQSKPMCMSNILGASKQTFILACGTVTWSMFSTWQMNLECEPSINSKA